MEKRTLKAKVNPQTLYNLYRLAEACGGKSVGWVIDKLVREKMLAMKEWRNKRGDG